MDFTKFYLLVLSIFIFSTTPAQEDILCMGTRMLCSKRYSDMTFPKTRASFAVQKSGHSPFATQFLSIEEQLNEGVLAFHLILYDSPNSNSNSEPVLCFPNCSLLNSGKLSKTLAIFSKWLRDHPYDILTLFLENYSTVSVMSISLIFESQGLLGYVLPKKTYEWPTLGSMVSSNKRLVVFEQQSNYLSQSINWINSYETNILRIDFSPMYSNKTWKCGPWNPPDGKLSEIPHYAVSSITINGALIDYLANPDDALYMNTDEYFYNHVLICKSSNGFNWVNFAPVDFYGIGNVKNVSIGLNYANASLDDCDFLPEFYRRTAPSFNDVIKAVKGLSTSINCLAIERYIQLFVFWFVLVFFG
ncbi:hypothetical protein BB560_000735 [Smittium megazygosporum]|uniref:Phosphatidylinositol-specific phospholipase C X domain-containing protein n=1 Tax=Smittium megazygosporum TaxID=133381 RepID=A0A2T9ZJG6_9FUNG|nr:hypothetical protein BB560_000735 [Smittium megazygosporum]